MIREQDIVLSSVSASELRGDEVSGGNGCQAGELGSGLHLGCSGCLVFLVQIDGGQYLVASFSATEKTSWLRPI